jgi:nucleotide-binding universal stress UspA family protein
MTMATLTSNVPQNTETVGSWYPPEAKAVSGPLLVATDGSSAGEAAFRAAATIATKSSTSVEVLIVVEPLPVLVPDPSVVMQPLVASPAVLEAYREGILGQLREIAPPGLEWRVDVEYGRPSSEIADQARKRKAQLIVIGLVHHGVLDRILDGDTALEVVRHSHTPVLLASSNWKSLPKHAVFAVDFSRQSMQAAREGLRLLGDNATVVLAHVRPMPTVYDGMGMWEIEYEEAAKKELAKFAEALNAGAEVQVQKMFLRGNPAAALLDVAEKIRADLIVAGTQGAGFMQRLLVGSVATRLMRHSARSLLIVPRGSE